MKRLASCLVYSLALSTPFHIISFFHSSKVTPTYSLVYLSILSLHYLLSTLALHIKLRATRQNSPSILSSPGNICRREFTLLLLPFASSFSCLAFSSLSTIY